MAEPIDNLRQALKGVGLSAADEGGVMAGSHRSDTDARSVHHETLSEDGQSSQPMNEPQLDSVAVGMKLGPYQLVRKLGEGGMGAVFEAQHVKLKKSFALKVLPPNFASHPKLLKRFEREMEAVGKLDHPNIIRATDADEWNGTHYLVMEYVEGTDLSVHVATGGAVSISEACDLIRQAALGLAHAHEHGLVHRDIKPSNLFVTRQGIVKILDLGLARVQGDSAGDGLTLTGVGQTMGTPDYMAPEQWEDTHTADGRSDLYALGCTLFFLLTSRAPFADGQHLSVVSKMKGHTLEPTPDLKAARREAIAQQANVANDGVSDELDALYQKLLSKNPEDRFATAGELAEALAAVSSSDRRAKPSRGPAPPEVRQKSTESVTAAVPSKRGSNSAGISKGAKADAAPLNRPAVEVPRQDSRERPQQRSTVDYPAIGIDLGTTFSLLAYLDATGRPQSLPNSEGDLLTPSVVLFDQASVVVGKEAVHAAPFELERVAEYAKREMGSTHFSKAIAGKQVPPEVIQAMILEKLRKDAESHLGPFQKVVITVPAFFNEPRRKATQDAGQLAGLDVIDIINEPTAAAIAFGDHAGFLAPGGKSRQAERILVYDLGGGTFDVTIMEIDGRHYNTRATAGDVYLGGLDWDRRLADYFAEEFLTKHRGFDPRRDPAAMHKLLREAEDAKRSLTAREQTTATIEFRGDGLRLPVTRAKFEQLTADLLERSRLTVRAVLKDAGLKWSDLTRVLLVGGSSRMPMVARMLEEESGLKHDRSVSADEAVAHGAALYAGLLRSNAGGARPEMRVTNVSSHDLGVFATEKSTGRPRNVVLIPRNTSLPASHSKRFKTHKDGQQSVLIKVIEGGDSLGNNSTVIGTCTIHNLPTSLPRGTPVDVTFTYHENGRLTVAAKVAHLKGSAVLTLDRASGLTDKNLAAWGEQLQRGQPLEFRAS